MNTATAFTSLPVIDISALYGNDPAAQRRVADELGHAARHVGFLYVTGHTVPEAVFDEMLAATRAFFALPLEEKMKVYIGFSTNHRGYVPEGEEVFAGGTRDKKEAYDLSIDLSAQDPDYLAGNRLLGPNQWPGTPGFREPVSAYYNATFELGRTLFRGFAMALDEAPDYFDKYITRPPSQLRLVHYPYDGEASDSVGIGAHTDYECFTLLRATTPGLEVMNSKGEWIDAPPVPGAYVINIGDMLELWTNGEFLATSHRVRKVKEERYSFPLFFNVDYYTKVMPLAKLQKPGEPERTPLIAGEHLFAQTGQSFTYLKKLIASGELRLPETAVALSSFGAEARLNEKAKA
ncbi:MAG: 2-oxoglutarate and iron-dependent oxygenase domain-containing protein [Parvibaculaceae bacterium]|nr:2-oxoglutarate and iron-dependent oxygenase domain-containing protein [Parvibaculaceae bacterium]